MKLGLGLILATIISVFVFSIPGTVFANSTTGTDINAGQVRTTRSGDALYLTTQVNENDEPAQIQNASSTNQTPRTFSTANRNAAAVISSIQKPIGFADNIGDYLSTLLTIIMMVSLLLVFFYFILAGFQWITSGGDKGKTEEARNKIVNAFVGILIVSSSFALATFVAYILGFESINDALSSMRQINPS